MKEVLKSYRYRIEPNAEQKILLNKHFGSVRYVYNYFINERKNQYRETKKSDNYARQELASTLMEMMLDSEMSSCLRSQKPLSL